MKKLSVLALALFLVFGRVAADEGMWLLPFLSKNMPQMTQEGLKLSAQDIYDINNSSLKDAIVIFGAGCTGEVVSDQGLVLTNHHCGYGAIQQHSSVEHDYLKNGFWAQSFAEEIPTPGLQVVFIRRIEDVTATVLNGVTEQMSEEDRAAAILKASGELSLQWRAQHPGHNVIVRDFFGGNQYLLFLTETYPDVRMVGAPPSAIGKFGGDTDNWMWPRHTGDFSVFRIYADANGKPAPYSEENKPYKPLKHLNISIKGIESGDFTMIMGFPGSTNRYMTSYEIDQVLDQDNPIRIEVRGVRQELMMADMKASDAVRIQYASKYASSSNYWKNSIGMSRGLRRLHVKDKKQAQEDQFTAWVAASPSRAVYAEALPLIKEAVAGRRPYAQTMQYISEALTRGTEIFYIGSLGATIRQELQDSNRIAPAMVTRIKNSAAGFYKDYNQPTDKKIAAAMLKLFIAKVPADQRPSFFQTEIQDKFGGDVDKYIDYLYGNTIFADQGKFDAFMNNPTLAELDADPAFVGYQSISAKSAELRGPYQDYQEKYIRGHRLYIAGLLEMEKSANHYPDANSTIRLTYGQVFPYKPADAVRYEYYTTLTGVMEKEDLTNPMEFTVPERLKELYAKKDFGPYALNGDVPVNFISNNDITGGNSGSPVMNGNGELIGLAFDGNWEAMSGDIAFEPELQRTISVDIRYVLFIIDKYAGAQRLIDEMTIVK